MQLLFGYDAHASSHHEAEVESQTSRIPDLDHDNRPLLAKEYGSVYCLYIARSCVLSKLIIAERSLDRSNALASAQIISMMLTKDKVPDPRPPIQVSIAPDNSDQKVVRDFYESKVAGTLKLDKI